MERNMRGYYTSSKRETDPRKCHMHMASRACELSVSKENFYDEWKTVEKYEVDEGEVVNCICGHVITKVYILENGENGYQILIGPKCIKRFGSKDLNKQVRNLNKIYCEHCDRSVDNIQTHNETKKHYKNVNSRKCLDCDVRIMNTEPSWKVRCVDCFIKDKLKEYHCS